MGPYYGETFMFFECPNKRFYTTFKAVVKHLVNVMEDVNPVWKKNFKQHSKFNDAELTFAHDGQFDEIYEGDRIVVTQKIRDAHKLLTIARR